VFAENGGKYCERKLSVTVPMVRERTYVIFRNGILEIA
jgi:hypothetical protein